MSKQFCIADSIEMEKRKKSAEKFYTMILDPDEIPYIVTDEASLYAFYAGEEKELIKRVKDKYGITIEIKDFLIPFWKLLDYLDKK